MRRTLPAPLWWLAALLSVYLLAPFVAGISQFWAADWTAVDAPTLGRAVAVSVASATLASGLIALGGIPLGLLLARARGRLVGTLGFLVQLPLALPPLASGVLLLFLLGRRSLIGRVTGGGLTDTFAGIVLAEIFVAAPFLIIAARSAFMAIDPMLEGVASTLGSRPAATFFRISLPLAWPTIRAGLLLAWLRAFGEFGATVMVAYHPYSLPVYTYVAFGSQGLPMMLPVVLPALLAAVVFMWLTQSRAPSLASRTNAARTPDLALLPQRLEPADGVAIRSSPEALPADPIAFEFRKQFEGFLLDAAWSPRARRLAILGPSGAGKSLLLRLIAGLESADYAVLEIAGAACAAAPPERRRIAYVPQNYCLFPHQTVAEQLRFPSGSTPAAAARWLHRLGLDELANRRPAELSLGQQQRVALARALVRPADLLLLDEPFSALDAPLRARLRREFRALQRELVMTTILVTHDATEAALLADELLVIADGRVLQAGPVAAVMRRPQSELVARLLGAEEVHEAIVVSSDGIDIGELVLKVAGPPLEVGRRVGWTIRSGGARLAREGRYAAHVEDVSPFGWGSEISVRVGHARLRIAGGAFDTADTSGLRLNIDADAVQVWPIASP